MTTTITIQTAGHRVELKTKAYKEDKSETLEMNRTRTVHIHSDIEIVGIRELPNEGALPQSSTSE